MKLADVTHVNKKDNRSEEGNYRPFSTLPKVFEQMSQYFERIISKYQCGFQKGHSAQHALISLLEKRRNNVYQGFGALLTDLSKTFDCLPHDIIIAKLYAYGVDTDNYFLPTINFYRRIFLPTFFLQTRTFSIF